MSISELPSNQPLRSAPSGSTTPALTRSDRTGETKAPNDRYEPPSGGILQRVAGHLRNIWEQLMTPVPLGFDYAAFTAGNAGLGSLSSCAPQAALLQQRLGAGGYTPPSAAPQAAMMQLAMTRHNGTAGFTPSAAPQAALAQLAMMQAAQAGPGTSLFL